MNGSLAIFSDRSGRFVTSVFAQFEGEYRQARKEELLNA